MSSPWVYNQLQLSSVAGPIQSTTVQITVAQGSLLVAFARSDQTTGYTISDNLNGNWLPADPGLLGLIGVANTQAFYFYGTKGGTLTVTLFSFLVSISALDLVVFEWRNGPPVKPESASVYPNFDRGLVTSVAAPPFSTSGVSDLIVVLAQANAGTGTISQSNPGFTMEYNSAGWFAMFDNNAALPGQWNLSFSDSVADELSIGAMAFAPIGAPPRFPAVSNYGSKGMRSFGNVIG